MYEQHSEPPRELGALENCGRLQQLEEQVRTGMRQFLTIGRAFAAILEEKLFEAEGLNFKQYCKSRFGISPAQAYRLIAAESIHRHLATSLPGITLPINEAQIRPLTSFSKDQQVAIWLKTLELAGSNRPTAAHVVLAIKQMNLVASRKDTDQRSDDELDGALYGFSETATVETDDHAQIVSESLSSPAVPNWQLTDENTPPKTTGNPQLYSKLRNASSSSDTEGGSFSKRLVPKEFREDRVGYWRGRALTAEKLSEHLNNKIRCLQIELASVRERCIRAVSHIQSIDPKFYNAYLKSC